MTTLVEDLRADIAYLEKKNPNGKLLADLRTQLAAYEQGPDRSAAETYFSGRPLETWEPQASADDPMRPPRSAGILHGDTDGKVQPSTRESKPLAPAEHEGGSSNGSTTFSFEERIDIALEKIKQQNKGKSLDDLELERERRDSPHLFKDKK